jgi:hypothetical protein
VKTQVELITPVTLPVNAFKKAPVCFELVGWLVGWFG